MRPDPDLVRSALVDALPQGARLCVAFSGGRDSTVMLHALAALRNTAGYGLRAAHVHHGLQPAADDWAVHCTDVCRELAVDLELLAVAVGNPADRGLEAAAREARYDALRGSLRPDEWLLTAHHADDQLETVLRHLLRGSGLAGLAGIPREAPFGQGRLARPLLYVDGAALAKYAEQRLRPAGLAWLEDPMNADPAYDRAYLRHTVTPALRHRFPAVARVAGRSATLAAEAAGLLDDLARLDAEPARIENRLSLTVLARLSPARQRNLVRFLVRERGWSLPPERRLREGLAQLTGAPSGRQPVLRWSGHEIRRFRDWLHLLDDAVPDGGEATQFLLWQGGGRLHLGGCRGELELEPGTGGSLAPAIAGDLRVGFRRGGERVRPGEDRHHRTLKHLFQSRGIVPWMRPHVPLIFAGERLAAVADLWVADWAAARPGDAGFRIVWTGHPPLQ